MSYNRMLLIVGVVTVIVALSGLLFSWKLNVMWIAGVLTVLFAFFAEKDHRVHHYFDKSESRGSTFIENDKR